MSTDVRDMEKGAVEAAVAAAGELRGVVSGLSAALVWGWSVKHVPTVAEITVPANRHWHRRCHPGVKLRRLDLHPGDVDGFVTTQLRTVLDCARKLPFDEALSVADSALHHGLDPEELTRAAARTLGRGAANIRRIADLANGAADNAFESCLRAIAIQVPGLSVSPQISIRVPTFLGRPDLVDEHLRIIIEADSFEFHGTRQALMADAQRYNRFVANGWIVLRFTWEDVMHHPDLVYEVLVDVVAERTRTAG